MAKALGIGGVFFKSPDPKKLAAWYQEWLELDINDAFGGSVFQVNALPNNAYTVWSPFNADTDYFEPSNSDFMLNLIVDDLDAVLSKLKQSGVQVFDKTEEEGLGQFGWFIDPDGRKVELWQPL